MHLSVYGERVERMEERAQHTLSPSHLFETWLKTEERALEVV